MDINHNRNEWELLISQDYPTDRPITIDDIKLFTDQCNVAFTRLNEFVEQLNVTQPDFIENCKYNIELAEFVALTAIAIKEKNHQILRAINDINRQGRECRISTSE